MSEEAPPIIIQPMSVSVPISPAPIQVDGQALLQLMARALVDSPATCRLLIGMGILEEVRRP